jgi:hypothetical protein
VITHLEEEGFPVTAVCQALGVSRAGYYVHVRSSIGLREQEDARLRPLVQQIFWENKRRYGARRIAIELAARGERCGPGRVSRLLKQLGLQAIQPRSFRPRTTQSRHPLGYSPNLLLKAKPPSGINQVWLGDITFVPGLCGRAYRPRGDPSIPMLLRYQTAPFVLELPDAVRIRALSSPPFFRKWVSTFPPGLRI